MSQCIVVQTKFGLQRIQVAPGVKSLPQSDIEQLNRCIEFIKSKKKLKERK